MVGEVDDDGMNDGDLYRREQPPAPDIGALRQNLTSVEWAAINWYALNHANAGILHDNGKGEVDLRLSPHMGAEVLHDLGSDRDKVNVALKAYNAHLLSQPVQRSGWRGGQHSRPGSWRR